MFVRYLLRRNGAPPRRSLGSSAVQKRGQGQYRISKERLGVKYSVERRNRCAWVYRKEREWVVSEDIARVTGKTPSHQELFARQNRALARPKPPMAHAPWPMSAHSPGCESMAILDMFWH